uniref:Uncharacterized protein n=1 Tax=Candidatus Kentrum eta TaxID=2126337 RepID=A0A450VNK2_9GAMM|nr:MAG: hypothetical protein BECKH772B_GA0070898_106692 [Candidatus Kentron sp. H]
MDSAIAFELFRTIFSIAVSIAIAGKPVVDCFVEDFPGQGLQNNSHRIARRLLLGGLRGCLETL